MENRERTRIYMAIEREISLFATQLQQPLKTVFLGGGTPSLVPIDIIVCFISRLPLAPDTEITIEANPSSISHEKAQAWRAAGINRVSMGVQALDDERLGWLGRVHSKREVFEALEALFTAGFKNVSIDYIVGVPNQSTKEIEQELSDALRRFPHIKHLSAYLLTLKRSNSKFAQLPDENEQLRHLRTTTAVLADFGFEHYEISNFARSQHRAQHNENYWLGGSYLGIGPSAHSFFENTAERMKNWASLGKYCELVESGQSPTEWSEKITKEQQRIEYLMLRLRRKEGVEFEEYRQLFGRDLLVERKNWIALWQERGLCQIDFNNKLRLTSDGFFLSDEILSNII